MTVEDLIEKVVRLRIFYDRNLHTESIRGNVIIVSSVVHALLSDLIKDEVLMRSLKLGKEAYGDFYEAINNSLSLGIVGKSTAKGLHLLRKLRNDLAHGVELMGDNHKVSERIGEISKVLTADPSDEPKWVLHGVAIKLIHGICYDYAESHGSSRDQVLALCEDDRLELRVFGLQAAKVRGFERFGVPQGRSHAHR